MQKRPLVAFEYVNTRKKDLPDQSTLRMIAEGQWGPRLDLTANVAWTLQPAGTVALPEPQTFEGGLRDFQAALQLEVPLKSAEQHARLDQRYRRAGDRRRVSLAEALGDGRRVVRGPQLHAGAGLDSCRSRRS